MSKPMVITATPTLFSSDLCLDLGANREHLEWLYETGVDAIFSAGTTGEFTTLDDREKQALLELSLEVFGAQRVYFHVGAPSAHQAAGLTARAVAAGATKLAAVTPYYQPAPEDQVLEYYQALTGAAGEAEVFAYLFEARTTTESRPEVLGPLAEAGVSGVKISGEPDENVEAFLAHRPEGFTVFSGNDISFEWLVAAGGDGIVSGVSSVYPEPFLGLRDALVAGDRDAAESRQQEVREAVAAVNAGSLTHLKAGVSARGFGGGPVRSAVAPVPGADVATITELARRHSGAAV